MRGAYPALLLSALLAGCSGGGGGAPSSQSNPPPSSPPPSNPPPSNPPPSFALTAANAVDAMRIVFGGVEQSDAAAKSLIHAAYFFSQVASYRVSAHCGSDSKVSLTLSYEDNDTSGDLSVGDVVHRDNTGPCAGVARTASLTITSLSDQANSIAGDVQFDARLDTGLEAQGSFHLIYSKVGNTLHWVLSDVSLATTSDGTTQTFTDTAIDKRADDQDAYTLAFSGTVDSGGLDGQFDFATDQAFSGMRTQPPTDGRLTLTAASSALRVQPPTDPTMSATEVQYALDADGSGQYGDPLTAEWSSLALGQLFDWAPDVPPRLTSVEIRPASPVTTDQLQATFSVTGSGYRRITYSYEWRRNGSVIDGQTNSWLPASFHEKGDVIQVTITADDGEYSVADNASTTILNAPPALTVNGILPPSPRTTDDLSVDMTTSDADGDTLQTAYVWRRNGTVIDGETGPVLPAAEHQRGDLIAVSVSISDGTDSVTGDASTTIQDSPPVLSVNTPPTSVGYGDDVTFQAAVSDADGDPTDQFKFALAEGPAGMTVDPDTGKVDWIPSGPMFDRSMDVNWGITVNAPGAEPVSGTIHVENPSGNYPLMRTGIRAPLWPSGLRVGDFDGDGKQEMLIASDRALYELTSDGAGGYRQSWAYPFAFTDAENTYGTADVTAIATGDVDGDGHQEIFASARGVIAELDGVERRVVRTQALDSGVYCKDLEFADLDGDGRAELICLAYGATGSSKTLIVLEADDLSIRWQFADADYGQSIAIGNVDADPALEIVTSAGYVFDGATFVNEWLYGPGFGFDVKTGDLDGDGVDEIVGAVDWTAVQVFSAELKSPLWEIPESDLAAILVADVDGDGTPEIIVGDGQWGNVTAYDYNTVTNGADVVFQIDSQGAGVSGLGVGDVDGDGQAEVIWGTNVSSTAADQIVIAGFDPDISVEWTNTDPAQLDGPFIGGELAGGPLDPPAPLFATPRTDNGYDGERLISMDADSGNLRLSPQIDTNWTGTTALTVSDFDTDGTDEIFLATSALYTGYFAEYDFFGGGGIEWTSPHDTTSSSPGVSVAHADLTGDGKDELIGMTAQGVVYVYDVFDQTLVWQSTTLQGSRKVLVTDLDGDGTPEILALTATTLFVYSRSDGAAVPYVQTASYALEDTSLEMRDLVVGDTDGDGNPEVFLLVGPSYLFDESSEVRRLDQNLQVLGSFDLAWRGTDISIEPSTFPRKNLIVPSEYPTGGPARAIAVDARTGLEVWRSPLLVGTVSRDSLHYVDVAAGGKLRISVGTARAMYLTR